MVVTRTSAVAAVHRLKEAHPKSLTFVCLLAAPEGIRHFQDQHPDVPIYTIAINQHLEPNS